VPLFNKKKATDPRLETYDRLIEASSIPAYQKEWMKVRWAQETAGMLQKTLSNARTYNSVRFLAVVFGVSAPVIVSLTSLSHTYQWSAVIVTALVAGLTAFEAAFRHGQRWRIYRQYGALLDAAGWDCLGDVALISHTKEMESHAGGEHTGSEGGQVPMEGDVGAKTLLTERFTAFSKRVEELLRQSEAAYLREALVLDFGVGSGGAQANTSPDTGTDQAGTRTATPSGSTTDSADTAATAGRSTTDPETNQSSYPTTAKNG
jgi:Protein of unknown function (DUF4231)